jgi:hypothetical protein
MQLGINNLRPEIIYFPLIFTKLLTQLAKTCIMQSGKMFIHGGMVRAKGIELSDKKWNKG